MSTADAAIQKKMYESGCPFTLSFAYEEMEDIIKIVKSPKESGLLIKGISETVRNDAKEQKR